MMKYRIEEKPDWRWWVTPRPLKEKPIHRWYTFPHSFSSELVHALIDEWGLGPEDHILDPFAGAGTTILAAKERGVPATGYDLLPLAVSVTCAKINNYSPHRLEKLWTVLESKLDPSRWDGAKKIYPELVKKALPGRLLGGFEAIGDEIDQLPGSPAEKRFFRLALLACIPRYSRAVITGGWPKWAKTGRNVRSLPSTLINRARSMIEDVHKAKSPHRHSWHSSQADARRLPDETSTYTAVITSPPYPNRHDYTRIFGVELMFSFSSWGQTRGIRYQSFHSHPEAHPQRPPSDGYRRPRSLAQSLRRIRQRTEDDRIPNMLEGYFLDMYLCLREFRRVCRPSANLAIVVGNAQYYGETILVDELTAEIGEQAGLSCEKLCTARYRGNSAQQMGEYGRRPSRESVVLLRVH
jgi:hypothetical protein